MTEQDRAARLAAIRARTAAATEGPWEVAEDYLGDGIFQTKVGEHAIIRCQDYERQSAAIHRNAAFIAHSRADVPWLVERLEQADAVVQAARATLWQGHTLACPSFTAPVWGCDPRCAALGAALQTYDAAAGTAG